MGWVEGVEGLVLLVPDRLLLRLLLAPLTGSLVVGMTAHAVAVADVDVVVAEEGGVGAVERERERMAEFRRSQRRSDWMHPT